MLVKTQAIVISALKYSEADLIVALLTKSDGIKSYLLRGVLKSKKGKLRASYFQPLTQLTIEANHKNKGTLESLREVKVTFPYQTLHSNVLKTSIVLFLSEVLKQAIREEEKNIAMFQFLQQSLRYFDATEEIANFHIYFLLNLTQYLGIEPDASNIELQYFNLLDGLFQDEVTNIYCEKGVAIETLKSFFGIEFVASTQIKMTKEVRLGVLNLLLLYYQLHLQSFKKPKSLDILQQLFN